MFLASWLRGRASRRRLQKIWDEACRQTEKQTRPLLNLGSAILRASASCQDGVKALLSATPEKDRQLKEIFVFYEFIWFFMHLTMRNAHALMSEPEIERLQARLAPMIAAVAVNSYFDHWPEDRKKGMTADFYLNLNKTEVEYSECGRLDSSVLPKDRTGQIAKALFTCLGEQIASIVGDPENKIWSAYIGNLALKEVEKMNLRSLIQDFQRDSAQLPPPPYDT